MSHAGLIPGERGIGCGPSQQNARPALCAIAVCTPMPRPTGHRAAPGTDAGREDGDRAADARFRSEILPIAPLADDNSGPLPGRETAYFSACAPPRPIAPAPAIA